MYINSVLVGVFNKVRLEGIFFSFKLALNKTKVEFLYLMMGLIK